MSGDKGMQRMIQDEYDQCKHCGVEFPVGEQTVLCSLAGDRKILVDGQWVPEGRCKFLSGETVKQG